MSHARNDTARSPGSGRTALTVGHLLRHWRIARGFSQLSLALHAGFSARHLSFIETGRALPSRQALLALGEALEIPLRERNRLLEAAGYARVFTHKPLEATEMAHVRGVLQFILDRHEPYAAVVLDRYSNCLMGNAASQRLIAALVDDSLLEPPVNFLRIAFHPQGARRLIRNWEEVAHHLLGRAERELGAMANDRAAIALLAELHGYVEGMGRRPPSAAPEPADLLLPIQIEKEGKVLALFSTLMTLGTPQDVTLQELRIETFFPANEESERLWRALGAQAP